MARRNDIQYVRFYTAGTAAPRIQPKAEPQVVTHPGAHKAKRIPVPFDPFSVLGTTLAVVMLALILVGLFQVNRAATQVQEMEVYITHMKAENDKLRTEYEHGYDLEEVRAAAVSMGMIPKEDAVHITIPEIQKTPIAEEETTSWWSEFWEDLRMLFA